MLAGTPRISGGASGGGSGGVTTLGPIGNAPNANAGLITGTTLILEPASASFGGLVTTGTQTFAGGKTFNGNITTQGKIFSHQILVTYNENVQFLDLGGHGVGFKAPANLTGATDKIFTLPVDFASTGTTQVLVSDDAGVMSLVSGSSFITGNPNQVAFFNAVGNLDDDSNFIWNSVDREFEVGDIALTGNGTTFHLVDSAGTMSLRVNSSVEFANSAGEQWGLILTSAQKVQWGDISQTSAGHLLVDIDAGANAYNVSKLVSVSPDITSRGFLDVDTIGNKESGAWEYISQGNKVVSFSGVQDGALYAQDSIATMSSLDQNADTQTKIILRPDGLTELSGIDGNTSNNYQLVGRIGGFDPSIGMYMSDNALVDTYSMIKATPTMAEMMWVNTDYEVTYSGLSGGSFAPGDRVTSNGGNEGTVQTDDGTTMVVRLDLPDAPFAVGATLDNGTGVTATIDSILNASQQMTVSAAGMSWNDFTNNFVSLYYNPITKILAGGDVFDVLNKTKFLVDDPNKTFTVQVQNSFDVRNTRGLSVINAEPDVYIFQAGDVTGDVNSTRILLTDSIETIQMQADALFNVQNTAGDQILNLDITNSRYSFGNQSENAFIQVDGVTQIVNSVGTVRESSIGSTTYGGTLNYSAGFAGKARAYFTGSHSGSPTGLLLPTGVIAPIGTKFTIDDFGRLASTDNITIDAGTSNTIVSTVGNSQTFVMNNDGESVTIIKITSDSWMVE